MLEDAKASFQLLLYSGNVNAASWCSADTHQRPYILSLPCSGLGGQVTVLTNVLELRDVCRLLAEAVECCVPFPCLSSPSAVTVVTTQSRRCGCKDGGVAISLGP